MFEGGKLIARPQKNALGFCCENKQRIVKCVFLIAKCLNQKKELDGIVKPVSYWMLNGADKDSTETLKIRQTCGSWGGG